MDSLRRIASPGSSRNPTREDVTILWDVPMVVEAEMGRTHKTVRDILKITEGSVIEFDKEAGEPVDLMVNGKVIARGEVVEIDGNYGVRIRELIG